MAATLTLWHKHMVKFFRVPEAAFGMLMQPILWVALFGIGMQAMMGQGSAMTGLAQELGSSYVGFMVPGIIIFSALSGAVAGGATLLDERLRGIVKEYLVAPIPRMSVLLGSALSTVTKGLIQAIAIVLIGILLGAGLSASPLGWMGGLLIIALYGLGVAGLALTVAARVNSTIGYHGLITLDLPLIFASNALYPLDILPGWMQWIARINPTTYAIDAVRRLVYGIEYSGQVGTGLCFLIVAAFAAIGMGLATYVFRSTIRQQGNAA